MDQITLTDWMNPTPTRLFKCFTCKTPYTNNLKALDCCYYTKVEKVKR